MLRFLLPLLALACLSCSSKSQSKKDNDNSNEKSNAYIHYYVRYLQAEDILEAQATFKLGDSLQTAIPLGLKETVYFNDKTMTQVEHPDGKTYYSYKDNSFYLESNNFKFTFDGKEYNHDLIMPPLDSFELKGDVSWSKGFRITWKGKPLKKKETVVLIISDQHGQTLSINRLGPTTTPEFFIGPEQIKKLHTGPGELYLVRKMSVPVPNPQARVKGSMRAEYYTSPIKIKIVQ